MTQKLVKAPQSLIDYWNAYGMCVGWSGIVDAKWRRDGCYVLLLCRNPADPPGEHWIADIAGVSSNGPWEMQNDSSDPITLEQWKKVRIVPECDWYRFPEDDDYPSRAG